MVEVKSNEIVRAGPKPMRGPAMKLSLENMKLELGLLFKIFMVLGIAALVKFLISSRC